MCRGWVRKPYRKYTKLMQLMMTLVWKKVERDESLYFKSCLWCGFVGFVGFEGIEMKPFWQVSEGKAGVIIERHISPSFRGHSSSSGRVVVVAVSGEIRMDNEEYDFISRPS